MQNTDFSSIGTPKTSRPQSPVEPQPLKKPRNEFERKKNHTDDNPTNPTKNTSAITNKNISLREMKGGIPTLLDFTGLDQDDSYMSLSLRETKITQARHPSVRMSLRSKKATTIDNEKIDAPLTPLKANKSNSGNTNITTLSSLHSTKKILPVAFLSPRRTPISPSPTPFSPSIASTPISNKSKTITDSKSKIVNNTPSLTSIVQTRKIARTTHTYTQAQTQGQAHPHTCMENLEIRSPVDLNLYGDASPVTHTMLRASMDIRACSDRCGDAEVKGTMCGKRVLGGVRRVFEEIVLGEKSEHEETKEKWVGGGRDEDGLVLKRPRHREGGRRISRGLRF